MTVRELIERLEEMPPDLKVIASIMDGTEVTEVEDLTEIWIEPVVMLT